MLSLSSYCLFKTVFQPTEPTLAIKFTDTEILIGYCCFKLSISFLISWLICLLLLGQRTKRIIFNRMKYLYPAVFVFHILWQLNQPRRANLKTNEVNLSVTCCLYPACCTFKTVFQPTEPTLAIKFTDAVILIGDCCFKLSISFLISWLICLLLLSPRTNWIVFNRMSYVYPAVFLF